MSVDYLDEEPEPHPDEIMINSQGMLDGAITLKEASEIARSFAQYLEDLASDGNELRWPIQEDIGFAYPINV